MERTLQDAERAYWEGRLGEDVSLNSVGYYGLSDNYVAWLYRIRARQFKRAVRDYVRPGMRVLDVGSGGGFYVSLWQSLGAGAITATDLTENSLRAIERRFPDVTTRQFDVGAPEVPAGLEGFDAISCMDVLHHLVDDEQYERALANCARLLKPGGMLVFTENFLHAPAYRGPHSVSRPLIHIERVLRGAGFRIALRRPMFVLMNRPLDSRSRIFAAYWKGLSYASENALVGGMLGALLYAPELALTALLREGPSTEICVAVRA